MICSHCKKKQASVHYKEIIEDNINVIHLCVECAEKKEKSDYAAITPLSSSHNHEKLSALSSSLFEQGETKKATSKSIKCPECDQSLQNIQEKGRLGCPHCYTTFAEALEPLLKKVHGSTQHLGKVPMEKDETFDAKMEVWRLEKQLQKAVDSEDYEKAAQLRDKIKALKEDA